MPRARDLVFVLGACLSSGCARGEVPAGGETGSGPEARMPGPYRGRLEEAAALDVTCEACHPREAAQWRGSRHHTAHTNAAYQRAFAAEPSPFCRGCHAPESDPRRDPPKEVGDLGVGCVSCHVTEEGTVLAAPSDADDRAANGTHLIRRSLAFAASGGCAGCHEFAFPGAPGSGDGAFMQTTVREHARSPSANKACADCHMPRIDGHRSHAFAEVRDPAWLRRNLSATVERLGDGEIRVTLAQPSPGHAFPTGDLFRRLEVGAEIRGKDGKALARDVRHLGRRFEILPGVSQRQLTRDDRVEGEPVSVDLSVGPRPGPIAWWVRYQRVATVGTGTIAADAAIESEVELHTGVVP